MLFALEVTAVAVSTQDLQEAEENKQTQAPAETGLVDFHEAAQLLEVDPDELLAQVCAIARRGLPEETGEVILDRTTTSSLEINEMRMATGIEHHIARLEVTVEKRPLRGNVGLHQVVGKTLEILLQPYLVEIHSAGLQEAVFEVVEVKMNVHLVHSGLRVAVGEIQPLGTPYLEGGQLGNRAAEQLSLFFAVVSARSATATKRIEERARAQVFLQVTKPIGRDGQYPRHGKPAEREVSGEVAEGVVLFERGANHPYQALALCRSETNVLPVAAGAGDGLHGLGCGTREGGIEFSESFHDSGLCVGSSDGWLGY